MTAENHFLGATTEDLVVLRERQAEQKRNNQGGTKISKRLLAQTVR